MLNAASNPVLLLGVEIHRFGLQDRLIQFIGKSGICFATTIMGKSVVNEKLPGFVGVYAGSLSNEMTRAAVEQSDCILNLGAMLTDLDTGIFIANLDPAKTIQASASGLIIQHHHYLGIDLATFLDALTSAPLESRSPLPPSCHADAASFAAEDTAISAEHVFECLDTHLSEDIAAVADPGDSLFGAINLTIHPRTEFAACAYYASLGFAVPAAIAMRLAEPDWQPLVLVGDEAFQMTGLELTTAARYGLTPIVIVIDNFSYGTERPMLDGDFNDVHPWNITVVPGLIDSGVACRAETEEQFLNALLRALSAPKQLVIIHVILAQNDISPALDRLTNQLRERV